MTALQLELIVDPARTCKPWPRDVDERGVCNICRVPKERALVGECWCNPGCWECGAEPGEQGCQYCWGRGE